MILLYYAFVLFLLVCSSAAQSIGNSGTVSSNPPNKTALLANITRECGVAKGCLLYPLGCSANRSHCVYVATWRAVINTTADDNIAEFELWTLKNNDGITTHWSSLALSDDEIPVRLCTYACVGLCITLCMHACVNVCMYMCGGGGVCACAHMHVCLCVCVCVCVCVCILCAYVCNCV